MEEQQNQDTQDLAPLIGTYYGHVVKVDKHRFDVMFKGADGTVYKISLKRKRLNDIQKQLLKVDLPVRVDFQTMKVAFMGSDLNYY